MGSEKRKIVIVPSVAASAVSKSKAKIFVALKTLAAEKDFDRISVREIYDLAGVSKSTFYNNFQDKNAIIHWHYDMVMGAGANKIGRTLSWEQGHLITSFGFADELPLYRAARKSSDLNGLLPYGHRAREAVLIKTLSEHRNVEVTDRLRFQVTALAAAEQAVVGRYLSNVGPMSVFDYVEHMISIVPQELFEAMQIDGNAAGPNFENPWATVFSQEHLRGIVS